MPIYHREMVSVQNKLSRPLHRCKSRDAFWHFISRRHRSPREGKGGHGGQIVILCTPLALAHALRCPAWLIVWRLNRIVQLQSGKAIVMLPNKVKTIPIYNMIWLLIVTSTPRPMSDDIQPLLCLNIRFALSMLTTESERWQLMMVAVALTLLCENWALCTSTPIVPGVLNSGYCL